MLDLTSIKLRLRSRVKLRQFLYKELQSPKMKLGNSKARRD
jgi:hypothetical protein